MDVLALDPNMLDATADIIIQYCLRQKTIIDEYMRKMNTLSYEWQDDETLGQLLQEVKILSNSVNKALDIMRIQYPPYFKKQAELIRHRPTL